MGNGQMKQSTLMQLARFRRMRWIVFAGVLAGISVSVALNVLHAPPTLVGRLISAWPPIALFCGIELISRIPATSRWLSIFRVLATLVVAGVAGSVSYVHMMGAVAEYGGETGWQVTIWPLSVDGLMAAAAVSLVEVVRKIRTLELALEQEQEAAESAPTPPAQPAQAVAAPVVPVGLVPATAPATSGPTPPSGVGVKPRQRRKPDGTLKSPAPPRAAGTRATRPAAPKPSTELVAIPATEVRFVEPADA